jgi:hypothetical protein
MAVPVVIGVRRSRTHPTLADLLVEKRSALLCSFTALPRSDRTKPREGTCIDSVHSPRV